MEVQKLNPSSPPSLHLISAFLAMEPNDCLISLARECGGGSITNEVQSLIWEHCINKAMKTENAPSNLYVKNFLKKIIVEVESNGDDVLDGLYEQFSHYITSIKDDILVKDNRMVCKTFTFLFPDDCLEVPSCLKSRKLEVPVRCSLNMLEGDTGCWIWHSSLYLSEFILSYPEIFTTKSCFEVGSGVGLVGIALALVKASKVILTDGDISTLATLKLNLELNQLIAESKMSQGASQDTNTVQCKYLSWELASENELQAFTPDIVLGADVMYDPSSFPHLIRVLSILLKPKVSNIHSRQGGCTDLPIHNTCPRQPSAISPLLPQANGHADRIETMPFYGCHLRKCGGNGPIGYIATIIRNEDTYSYFLDLASQSHLRVVDITESLRPFSLLRYMKSYNRLSVRLLTVTLCH